jgi:Radical SAM superfamily/Iron-sulfur cluster-binding domain
VATALPDAAPLASLTVAYSWLCDFECAHCGQPPGDGPRGHELTAAELGTWLRSLPETLCWVCFTGGEPTLDPDRLVAGVSACTSARVPSTLLTHGKWIAKPKHGERLMRRLWDAGLRAFGISYDEYHDPFWPKERAKESVSKAAAFGFDITVKLVRTPNYAESLRGEFLGAGAHAVTAQALDPVGRGKLLPVLPSSQKSLGSCLELLSPMLTPNGDVYACCSSRSLGPDSSHYLGNARQTPLREILDRRQENGLLLAEMVLGPGGLAELLGEEPFGQLCGLCHELMSSPAKVTELRARIQEPDTRRRVLGRHLLFQSQDDRRELLLPIVYDAWADPHGN